MVFTLVILRIRKLLILRIKDCILGIPNLSGNHAYWWGWNLEQTLQVPRLVLRLHVATLITARNLFNFFEILTKQKHNNFLRKISNKVKLHIMLLKFLF